MEQSKLFKIAKIIFRYTFFISAVLLLSALSNGAQAQDDLQKELQENSVRASDYLYQYGLELYKKGAVDDAIHEISKSLIINPNNPIVKEKLANLMAERRRKMEQGEEIQTEPEFKDDNILDNDLLTSDESSAEILDEKLIAQKDEDLELAQDVEEEAAVGKANPLMNKRIDVENLRAEIAAFRRKQLNQSEAPKENVAEPVELPQKKNREVELVENKQINAPQVLENKKVIEPVKLVQNQNKTVELIKDKQVSMPLQVKENKNEVDFTALIAELSNRVSALEKDAALRKASDQTLTPDNKKEISVLQNEVITLRKKVEELEKAVAIQSEFSAQQKQVLEKISEAIPAGKTILTPPEPKTLVKFFDLDGVDLFYAKEFEPILKKYRDQELGMSDLKKIGEELSAFYRSKGYISSIAYLPTQEITNNTVEFKVVEGRVGEITAETPKYSKRATVEKRFLVKKGAVLNSKEMEASLERINANQDRTVRAVLTPGKTQGTSDILLKVEKERAPYHFYNDFNNRGTNATNERRWGLGFVNTNLLGLDDALSLKFMASPTTSDVYSISADYNLPVNRFNTRVGAYAAYAKADIAGQFAIISPEGRAQAIGIYASHPLFKKEFVDEETSETLTLASNLTAGFDYIDVRNKVLGQETSHDVISALKGGINFDEKDSMGRAMLSAEMRAGIPDFLGSLSTHDVNSSRIDAGGEFQKYNLTLNRTTYLPFSSVLLNNFRFQFADDPLVASEQMVLGGADSVRGFPENEYLADYGWIANVEIRSPAFLVPRMLRVPFDKKHTRLADALQFVYFLDAGEGQLNKARVGETKKKYLVGAGFGLRMDLYQHLRGRLDIGFPTGNEEPSDGAAYRVHYGLQYEW